MAIDKEIDYMINEKLMYESLVNYYAKKLGISYRKSEVLKENEHVGFVCLNENDEAVGRLNGEINYISYSCHVEGLFVEPEARGAGTGRKLLLEFESIAQKKGCIMSFIETTTNSAPEFYEKLGYSLIGTIADYPIANETFYLYKKRLEEVN